MDHCISDVDTKILSAVALRERNITWRKFSRCYGVRIGKFSRYYEVSRNGAARFSEESGRLINGRSQSRECFRLVVEIQASLDCAALARSNKLGTCN